ncbi:MAG: hypothetical protein HY687_02155 [Chloroflexi bacterium]|nr:hypothetical protein [Chloroflexota bacterium]
MKRRRVGLVSALIYTPLSAAAAALFLLAAPVAAGGDLMARYGGAGWVFLLSMVVTMPTITPLVKRWLKS